MKTSTFVDEDGLPVETELQSAKRQDMETLRLHTTKWERRRQYKREKTL